MSEHKQMTEQELLSADLMVLSEDQLAKRSLIINIRKAERELEVSANENEEFQTKKKERMRMKEVAIANSKAERQKIDGEQMNCAHKTGGEGLAGFFQGDGSIYGTSTVALRLPTQEVYYLCFRCQREWHLPLKRDFLNGRITIFEYEQQLKDYQEVSRWPRKTFAPMNGEICSASTFEIPLMRRQLDKDNSEFDTFMAKLKDLTAPGPKVEGGRA